MPSSKPYLSIIIPAYNASERLGRLMDSLKKSLFKNFEVIVGDDASREQVSAIRYQVSKKIFSFKIIRLSRNRGPAAARNAAACLARGRVLVFLDADVTIYPDTLLRIAEKFQEDRDLTALTGVWDKEQHTTAFFPQFKAMRDWSYWTNERDRDGYYYLFSTRVAAIRREVFSRLGGFNEAFRQMEDVELTYRIAKRYAIIFAPDVRVHHEFETFWPVAQKYFWRSFYWAKLYKVRRKFDPVATTMSETVTAVSGVGSVLMLWGVFLSYLSHLSILSYLLAAWGILVATHLFFLRKFLWFCFREKGFWFAVKSLFTGLALYVIILSGAAYYQLRK